MCNSKLRYTFLVLALCVSGGLSLTAPVVFGAGGPLAPAGLRCEYLKDPVGIDVRQPRFAWVLRHAARAQRQSAYQVLVAARRSAIEENQGDQWDSGKVTSDNSTQVAYGGKPLASGRTYYWKIRYWDKDGSTSAYSQPAQFEMGLLGREEWKAQWIGGNRLLRKETNLTGRVVRARAYVTALGYYELRINGAKVGANVLDPAWTTYPKRVLYSTYDVTAQLKQGANALGVMLGGGWATLAGKPSTYPFPPYYSSPALLLQVNIELEGGKKVTVVSDPSWKTTGGPIVSDSVYDGEVYDSRLEIPGWDQPGFDASRWDPAKVVEGSNGILSAQMMPPIQVVDAFPPLAVTNPAPGVYVYDFGQNFSGWVQLRVKGPRGSEVKLRFSELVYDTGMINRENIRAAKSRDIYILRGEGTEVYEPRFTYHGFRYVEVTGYPGTPSLDSLRGKVVHTAVESTGKFETSKQILNQIQHNIRWGQATNLHSVPTDCDQRDERQGWMGDAQVTAEEAMLNFDMAAFYTNFVRNIHDIQGDDGTVTDTVPHRYGSRPADPAWGTAYPLLCWYMYQQYGDKRILEENYEGLKKYIEFLRSKAQDNVLRYSYYGDWVSIEPTPGALVSDFYYYYDVDLLAKIADVLGNPADSATYSQLAVQIKDAFNHEFLNTRTGNYATGSQTANTLPLFLEMVPKDQRGQVGGNLFYDLVYAHDSHVTTGFIGVKYLFPVLTRRGLSDLAYDIATQTTFPSYGYMVANGATTLWELWQKRAGPSMNSHNHPMFGSIGAWFYQALAGINVEPEGVGYQRIRIAPQVVRDLTSVNGKIETVRGAVSSSWTHSPDTITLDVEIPVNSSAKIVIPKDTEMTEVTVREGNNIVWGKDRFVPGTPGVTAAEAQKNGSIQFEVGSGRYSFRLTGE